MLTQKSRFTSLARKRRKQNTQAEESFLDNTSRDFVSGFEDSVVIVKRRQYNESVTNWIQGGNGGNPVILKLAQIANSQLDGEQESPQNESKISSDIPNVTDDDGDDSDFDNTDYSTGELRTLSDRHA